jgi:hypothetical protein
MDTFPGNAMSFDDEVRQEIDSILNRLGRVIGRRLTLKGIPESDGFLLVVEALLELARHRRQGGRQVEDPDRWLIELLEIGPYDPVVIEKEIEEERRTSEADRRARVAMVKRLEEIERQRKIWMERKSKPFAASENIRMIRPRRPGSKPPGRFGPV